MFVTWLCDICLRFQFFGARFPRGEEVFVLCYCLRVFVFSFGGCWLVGSWSVGCSLVFDCLFVGYLLVG